MTANLAVRLMARVERTPTCWLWTGKRKSNGYGVIKDSGSETTTHRAAYRVFVGAIPDGMSILHSCDVRNCVNPAHLRAGTAADNNRDTSDRKRFPKQQMTHCKHGHEFTMANTYFHTRNGREVRDCRACNRQAVARLKARKQGLLP